MVHGKGEQEVLSSERIAPFNLGETQEVGFLDGMNGF